MKAPFGWVVTTKDGSFGIGWLGPPFRHHVYATRQQAVDAQVGWVRTFPASKFVVDPATEQQMDNYVARIAREETEDAARGAAMTWVVKRRDMYLYMWQNARNNEWRNTRECLRFSSRAMAADIAEKLTKAGIEARLVRVFSPKARRLAALERVAGAARELLSCDGGEGVCYDATRYMAARAALREALDAAKGGSNG